MYRAITRARAQLALLFSTAIAATFLVTAPAHAQSQCGGQMQVIIQPSSQTVPALTGGQQTLVTLDGQQSSAPAAATFHWTQIGGPVVTLSGANTRVASFTVPAGVPPQGLALEFRLTASCGTRSPNAADTTVNVTYVAVNNPPSAHVVATPSDVYEGGTVVLDGSGSTDIDGDTLQYLWEQVDPSTGLPLASPVAFMPDAHSPVVSFVAPNTPASIHGTTLRFRLTVSDGALSSSAIQLVTVLWVNDPPTAQLACPLEVDEGAMVTLDGSGSFDPDDGIVSYAWSQTSGPPNVEVAGLSTPTVQFPAPALSFNQLGPISFDLTVTDATGDSDARQCTIFINDVTPPVIAVQDLEAEATSAAGAAVAFTVHAQDAADDESPYPLPDAACAPPSGSVFPLGAAPAASTATPVECTATDANGNLGTASFQVTVRDSTAPQIHVPGSHAVEATGPDGAIADYGPIATSDAVDGAGTATCLPASGTLFAIGTTEVECEATDARGNSSQATFPVVVHDLTPPVFGPAPDVLAEAQSASGAVVDYDVPTAVDLVDGPVAVGCLPAPGGTFALGSTTVSCSAADGSGNTAQVQFDVIVEDTTPPTLALPADITQEATSASGAVVVFAASASDLVDGEVLVACTPASGTLFPLDATTVSCSATDVAGNTASDTFTVTVVDTTPPVIAPHPDLGPIEATGPGGAQVFYTAPATADAVDGPGVAQCLPGSGTIFAIGATSVTCTAVDAAGNAAPPTGFTVTVHDSTPPVVTPPADVGPVEATGPLTAVALGTATATDAVGVVEESNDAPAAFPVGTTTITWIARDAAGNVGSATSTVTVVDTTPPTIDPMADITGVEATGPGGAVVAYASPATHDLVDGAGTAACAPASGSTFALGTTPVTCTASDSRGNPAVPVVFQVGVVDTTAPVVTPPANVQAEATGPMTVVAFGSATATDAVGVVSLTDDAPASFPLGATVITWTARDAAGNIGTATSTVTVVDTTAPAFDPYADVYATATGNSQAIVHFALPTASDLVDGPVPVNCSHASGASYPAGSTTVTCSAQDGRTPANVATMSFQVHVTYDWTGFFRPIDNLPTVNTVKAGSAVPVKFSLGGNQGMDIFEVGFPRSGPINCTASNQDEITETVTAGQSSLSYDAGSGQYVYVWKTERSWSGCRVLQVKLRDGRSHYAMFQFR